MDRYLSPLVKRLRPDAAEINAYRDNGQIEGYARDATGELLPWPTMAEFEAEWKALEAELNAELVPQPEVTLATLQARLHLLEDALVALITGQDAKERDSLVELLRLRQQEKVTTVAGG